MERASDNGRARGNGRLDPLSRKRSKWFARVMALACMATSRAALPQLRAQRLHHNIATLIEGVRATLSSVFSNVQSGFMILLPTGTWLPSPRARSQYPAPLRHRPSPTGRRRRERRLDLIPPFLILGEAKLSEIDDPTRRILRRVRSRLCGGAQEVFWRNTRSIEADEYVDYSINDSVLHNRSANTLLVPNCLHLNIHSACAALGEKVDRLRISERHRDGESTAIQLRGHEVLSGQMCAVSISGSRRCPPSW